MIWAKPINHEHPLVLKKLKVTVSLLRISGLLKDRNVKTYEQQSNTEVFTKNSYPILQLESLGKAHDTE